jgi:hypothetical protein
MPGSCMPVFTGSLRLGISRQPSAWYLPVKILQYFKERKKKIKI